MWRRRSSVLAIVVLAACGGGAGDPEPSPVPSVGADTPVAAVEELVEAINAPDFANASRLAVPGQAALAALAEGATFGEVASSLSEGDTDVAANFWAGFAQGTASFLAGDVTAVEDGTVEQDGVTFHRVVVTPPDGDSRTLLIREDDGYRIDLFASFGPGLADKMIGPVERLLNTQTGEAGLILSELQDIVPSLLASASLPGTTPETSQQLIALIEVITRVS
jgi:hypothetical protein